MLLRKLQELLRKPKSAGSPPVFLKDYGPQHSFTLYDSSYTPPKEWVAQITEELIGELLLPSGQVVACDPYTVSDPSEHSPFTIPIPPGTYPVFLGMADEITERHFASQVYAVVHLSPQVPVRWELALVPGQSLSELTGEQFFGYGVDSGEGCFVDQMALPLLAQRNPRPEIQVMGSTILDTASGLNVVAFIAGMGDGAYPTYWGFDQDGTPCRLLTDFQILRSSL